MIRNQYNQILYPALKTKRKRRTHTKIDKRSQMARKVNQINSSFPNRWSFSYLIENSSNIYFTYFLFYITKQNKTKQEANR